MDVLIFDATNGLTYDAEREALCLVLEQMQSEGHLVPRIAIFANAGHNEGVPGAGRYINKTGRNDLDTMQVGYDATHLFFHVTTREPLTPSNDVDWMILLLDTDQDGKTDNIPPGGDGMDFLDQGDTAPNARFNYRFLVSPTLTLP